MCKVIFTFSSTSDLNQLKSVHLHKWDPFTIFAFKTTSWLTLFFYSMVIVNSKIGKFVKTILFAGLALPFWLRHILHNVFDPLLPVTEVMIFTPTWPTIRWRMSNIPKRILVSTYMLIASPWKINCFWIWKQRK